MRKNIIILITICLATLVLTANLSAQETTEKNNTAMINKIDSPMQRQIIEFVIKNLNEIYIFPDVAKKLEIDIRRRQKNNEYEKLTDPREFADKLTADLLAGSQDKHLGVQFSQSAISVRAQSETKTPAETARYEQFLKMNNYAFTTVENLPGNVGYIEFRGFIEPDLGAEKLATAMNFVSDSDALIFDMRRNQGGEAAMVALVCSYLFGEKPVHLNDLYSRQDKSIKEFWTKPTVIGKKFPEKKVYILTSKDTFSAAEEFANNLKTLKRAIIVGETTGGGANSGEFVRINEHFQIYIPNERAVNPITKTNWEGTGIEPDVKVPAEQAKLTAYLLALNALLNKSSDENVKNQFRFLINQTQIEQDAMKKSINAK